MRSTLARSKTLRTIYHKVVPRPDGASAPHAVADGWGAVSAEDLQLSKAPAAVAVRAAYETLLERTPNDEDTASWAQRVESGELTVPEMFQAFHAADEYSRRRKFSQRLLGHSIHSGRQQFIKSLPKASRIVDLGGSHQGDEVGAFVAMGYPYRFDELTIVDLPFEDRHDIYRTHIRPDVVHTPKGKVTYRYHSMTDLSSFEDESVDLVYSGQSFEHVTAEDGVTVLKEVQRILRPGGHLAMDTPNGRVCRLQQEHFIDPDHKIEYTYPELREVVTSAGYTIVTAKGLNYAGGSVASGTFDVAETAGNAGIYDQLEECYILCLVLQKPVSD